MPETPDWSAAPQAVVLSLQTLVTASELAAGNFMGVGSAGKRVVIVGLGLTAATDATGNYTCRGIVSGIISDSLTGNAVGNVAISPEVPYNLWAPPPGSVVLTSGADVEVQLGTAPGTGACFVDVNLSYYYV